MERLVGYMVGRAISNIKNMHEPIGYLYGHVSQEDETPTNTIDGVGLADNDILTNMDTSADDGTDYLNATDRITVYE